jgi:hypothetical protein
MNESPGSRQDMQDLNIRQEIWLQPPQWQGDEYYMLHAPYRLKPNERRELCTLCQVYALQEWRYFASSERWAVSDER